ncbi:hypothetical protein FA95DRAFT_469440 [Auriscalpium vulgare]|uniref:Uncharacterized protein n=1 Tax=Auriscalpium vulgare TaxID=40419 RepID=A0ACB8SAQ8_9AGAM|nr:hypothetical protein FA95DRAFT_469440 [Auriscalpium vulgare]
MAFPPSPRRSHRKRFSALTLSSDTTSTLPVYSSWRIDDVPEDQPPDYPESADEGDADTDSDTADTLPPLSPTRSRRHLSSHRRRHSSASPIASTSTDPYLDSLLARSVHALELSNALLQSSMSTQTSLSAVLAADGPTTESGLEARAQDLSARIRTNSGVHRGWMDDLNLIAEQAIGDEGPVSRSLPVPPSPLQMRRSHAHTHSSMDLRTVAAIEDGSEPQLALAQAWPRARLVAPAPRALTQYIESTEDPEFILLPSTLGVRSATSSHFSPEISGPSPRQSPPPTQPTPSEPSTPAYNLLSSFIPRRASTSSNGSRLSLSSRSRSRPKRRASSGSGGPSDRASRTPSTIGRSRTPTPVSSLPSQNMQPGSPRARRKRPSSSPPAPLHLSPHLSPHRPIATTRPLTPPTENLLPSSSGSSPSSSPSDSRPNPVLTLQALRKILDDAPPPASPQISRTASEPPPTVRKPAFQPRTPRPPPTLGTSTATASISRLFSPKHVHLHGASSRATPRHSVLKSGLPTSDGLVPPSPAFSSGGSGASTPKRISFAELPESYAGVSSGRGFEKKRARKGKGKGKGRDSEDDEPRGWWRTWFAAGPTLHAGVGPEEGIGKERERGGGARMVPGRGFGFGAVEEWAV